MSLNFVYSSCAVRFIKSEVLLIKQVKVNYKKKYFTTSVIKDTRRQIKNVKSPQSQQKPGENLENTPNPPHSFSLLLKPFIFTIVVGILPFLIIQFMITRKIILEFYFL